MGQLDSLSNESDVGGQLLGCVAFSVQTFGCLILAGKEVFDFHVFDCEKAFGRQKTSGSRWRQRGEEREGERCGLGPRWREENGPAQKEHINLNCFCFSLCAKRPSKLAQLCEPPFALINQTSKSNFTTTTYLSLGPFTSPIHWNSGALFLRAPQEEECLWGETRGGQECWSCES